MLLFFRRPHEDPGGGRSHPIPEEAACSPKLRNQTETLIGATLSPHSGRSEPSPRNPQSVDPHLQASKTTAAHLTATPTPKTMRRKILRQDPHLTQPETGSPPPIQANSNLSGLRPAQSASPPDPHAAELREP